MRRKIPVGEGTEVVIPKERKEKKKDGHPHAQV
jgi:hypothetical protein